MRRPIRSGALLRAGIVYLNRDSDGSPLSRFLVTISSPRHLPLVRQTDHAPRGRRGTYLVADSAWSTEPQRFLAWMRRLFVNVRPANETQLAAVSSRRGGQCFVSTLNAISRRQRGLIHKFPSDKEIGKGTFRPTRTKRQRPLARLLCTVCKQAEHRSPSEIFAGNRDLPPRSGFNPLP